MLTLRKRLSITGWLVVLSTLFLTIVSTRYLFAGSSFQWWQVLQFYLLGSSHFFLLSLLINGIFVFGLGYLLRRQSLLSLWAALVNGVLLVAIVADTFVFDLYRFHLNFAVLDLFINGGGEVIKFSFGMWVQIWLIVAGVGLFTTALVYLANRISRSQRRALPWMVLLFVCWIVANVTHAVGIAKAKSKITVVAESVPWVQPVQMNRFFRKTGLVDVVDQVKVKIDGVLNYPLKPLKLSPIEKPLNIVFVWVDSLRADSLNPEVMPNTWAISKESQHFTNHYSSGNATRAGIFGLFYGLPPTYWHSALATHTPAAFVDTMLKQNYEVEAFTAARLNSPEFAQTVFASVPNIRQTSEGNNSWERDQDAILDFGKWLDQRDTNKPFFSFLFFDNIHGYNLDPNVDYPFKPHWETVNNLKLNNDLDPTEFFNLYKNCAYESDRSIQKVWDILKKKGLLENTIVVISSDHGEEFNDNRQNYWGHNGNFTDAQIKIPLVIHWPGKAPQRYDHMTTAYDLTATFMPEVLGCENVIEDYSIGKSIWTPSQNTWFLSGSYHRTALVEDNRIVLFDLGGMLMFKDRQFRDSENTARTANLLEAIKLFSKYRSR